MTLCFTSQKLEVLPRAIFPSSNQSPRRFQDSWASLSLQSPPQKNSNGLGQGRGQGPKKVTMGSLSAFLPGDQGPAPSWCHCWVEAGTPGDGQPLPPQLLFWPLCSSVLSPSGFSPFTAISGFLRWISRWSDNWDHKLEVLNETGKEMGSTSLYPLSLALFTWKYAHFFL